MRLVDFGNRVSLEELRRTAADKFGDMVKAIVDVRPTNPV